MMRLSEKTNNLNLHLRSNTIQLIAEYNKLFISLHQFDFLLPIGDVWH